MSKVTLCRIGCLLSLLAVAVSCGGSAAPAAAGPPREEKGMIDKVEFLQDKSSIEGRDCVAVGRVTARGTDVEEDLKTQAKDLGGNYVVVNAYTYKRKNLGYGVKGVAYYCY